MFLVVLILLWCTVFALWWYMKPRGPSPPVYPGALPLIGHGHLFLVDALQRWQLEKKIVHFCLENGGVVEIRLGPQSLYERWQLEKKIVHFCLENGGVVEIRLGPQSLYVITEIEDCQTIANTCLDKPYFYNFGKDLYDKGLVTAQAITWKPHRKLLNPAFNQQILNTFVKDYSEQAKRLVSELASEAGKDSFDVIPYLLNTVLRDVFKTTTGVKPHDNEQEVTLKIYANGTDNFFDFLGARFATVWLHLPFIFNMSSMKKKQDEVIKTLKNITQTIVTKRKSELKQIISSGSIKEATPGYKSVLNLLLEAGAKQDTFTDEEIREHLDTIIGAAYDSSTMAMTFCLILIGSYPDVQAKVIKELQEVLVDPDRDLTKHDLPKLVYLEAVLKETLRLYPPVPRIAKCGQSAVKLRDYTLPAGSMFVVSLYGMNRHSTWGSDANEFKPERWLDPATLPDNPNAFATFSIGKRNCLGKQNAMMTMKTTLAYVLRRYRVTGDTRNVQCKCDLIFKPVIGHHISLELRT